MRARYTCPDGHEFWVIRGSVFMTPLCPGCEKPPDWGRIGRWLYFVRVLPTTPIRLWCFRLGLIRRCLDCRRGTWAESYMVHAHLWAAAGLAYDDGCLCIGCLESRLGRRLHRGDFAHTNYSGRSSQRLIDRLTTEAQP
jgi:hypothetical protein